MTPEEIAQDRAICEAASDRPWWREDVFILGYSGASVLTGIGHHQEILNAAAAAHAVNRLPAYIVEAEEMARRIAEVEAYANELGEDSNASVLWWALDTLRGLSRCPRCTGSGILQNPEDGWRPGLVLTREAEDAVRAAFAGKPAPEVKQKWRVCPLCNGTAVRGEK